MSRPNSAARGWNFSAAAEHAASLSVRAGHQHLVARVAVFLCRRGGQPTAASTAIGCRWASARVSSVGGPSAIDAKARPARERQPRRPPRSTASSVRSRHPATTSSLRATRSCVESAEVREHRTMATPLALSLHMQRVAGIWAGIAKLAHPVRSQPLKRDQPTSATTRRGAARARDSVGSPRSSR